MGKARSLRDRVRSYLGAYGTSPKTDALLDEADGLDVILTDSVVEALALENNLIKQRMPKYNILLRDDKNYPYLQLTTSEAFPRVLVARRVERDGNVYAGPFMPASLARRVMSLSHRLFGIRSCNEEINGRRGRPCLEYDIKRCLAPCVEALCTRGRSTRRAVEDTRLFLEGRTDELLDGLKRRMADGGGGRAVRAGGAAARRGADGADAARPAAEDGDASSSATATCSASRSGRPGASIQVFQVRRGRVIERVDLLAAECGPGPGLASTLVASEPDGQASLGGRSMPRSLRARRNWAGRACPRCCRRPAAVLRGPRGAARGPPARSSCRTPRSSRPGCRRAPAAACASSCPKRGEKRGLLDLAARNAALAYQSRFNRTDAAHYDGLDTLRVGARPAGAAAPHRVLRHLHHPGQRDRGVDGGLRGRADEALGVPEVPDPADCHGQAAARPEPGPDG